MYEQMLPVLRRLAGWDRTLPPPPWEARERSHLEVHGPAEFEQEIDVSLEAFERNEAARAERAAWRGLIDADGNPLVGEPLSGGSPRVVHDPVWLAMAELRSELPKVLELLRDMWRELEQAAPTERPQPTEAIGALDAPDPELLEACAAAACQALGEPIPYAQMSAVIQEEWRKRAAAVLACAGVAGPR